MGADDRRSDDRGVAIVEMALVLPILVVLMLGMFTGALAWNQSQALGQGARVAARYASTLPLPADVDPALPSTLEPWLKDLANRAVAASEGSMGAGVDGREVCVAYVDPRGTVGGAADHTASLVMDSAGSTTVSSDPCFDDEQGVTARRVQFELRRDSYIDTGFYRVPLDLRRVAVYRYEAHRGL